MTTDEDDRLDEDQSVIVHPRVSWAACLTLAVMCRAGVARAEDPIAPAPPPDETPLAPRFGPLLGGGVMLNPDAAPPTFSLFGEIGGALRLELGPVFHAVVELGYQHRGTSNDSIAYRGPLSGRQLTDDIDYTFDIVAGRLLGGWWLGDALAFRAGFVVGHAWTQLRSEICADMSIGRAVFGPTFGAALAFGTRRQVEATVLIEAVKLPRVDRCRSANGAAEYSLSGGKILNSVWPSAVGHLSYFF